MNLRPHESKSSKIPLWFETSPFRGKRVVDKTAEPMKSFSVTPPFREGQSARPLSVGCGVSRRTGRLWIETCALPSVLRLGLIAQLWRKGWDSNPRAASHRRRFSRPLHSTALPPFRGAGAGTRTPNLRITNPLLCQLSHTGMAGREVYPRP